MVNIIDKDGSCMNSMLGLTNLVESVVQLIYFIFQGWC